MSSYAEGRREDVESIVKQRATSRRVSRLELEEINQRRESTGKSHREKLTGPERAAKVRTHCRKEACFGS